MSWITWVAPDPLPVPPILPAPPTDQKIGLDAHGLANTFTIMEDTTPDGVAVRLNNVSEHLLEYIEGVDGVTISEIYITSAEPTGTIKVYAAWEAQWE
jgi:hypothetical protein